MGPEMNTNEKNIQNYPQNIDMAQTVTRYSRHKMDPKRPPKTYIIHIYGADSGSNANDASIVERCVERHV